MPGGYSPAQNSPFFLCFVLFCLFVCLFVCLFFFFFGAEKRVKQVLAKVKRVTPGLTARDCAFSARQGKREKYSDEAECVTYVPIGCILNR
jgi:hypothetical protein